MRPAGSGVIEGFSTIMQCAIMTRLGGWVMAQQGPPPLHGLRHLALRVSDIGKAKAFYVTIFGMKVVWEPDPQNVYLSSGADNLALHEISEGALKRAAVNPLDHFGFIARSPAIVDAWAEWATQQGVALVKPPKLHRDGSYSCYLADPDGNQIQIFYDPSISRL
jgi:catechol 2,3-dioxygenase-like lactoylglutathione lyase family enzyme